MLYVCLPAENKLTESSLCLLETLSQKSLKLTLGSVAGPVKHENRGGIRIAKRSVVIDSPSTEHRNRTHLVCWCVVALSYRVNSVQETVRETQEIPILFISINNTQQHKIILILYIKKRETL